MPLDKDELKKLSPEDRIKKLKELEEETKKELEEAADLIKRTEEELEHDRNIPNIDVPELKPVDISAMFEAPEGIAGTVQSAKVEEEETTPVKYGGTAVPEEPTTAYVPDEHDWVEFDFHPVMQPGTKYESAVHQTDELTASRSVLKNIKKYTGN